MNTSSNDSPVPDKPKFETKSIADSLKKAGLSIAESSGGISCGFLDENIL